MSDFKMKVEYIDGIKCGKCPNCENYTIDQEEAGRPCEQHCIDCGWLDEI